jgi:hypothetical protein
LIPVRKMFLHKNSTAAKKKNYWIVVGTVVTKDPFRHYSAQEALIEAERLADENPKQTFTVFQATCKVRKFLPDSISKIVPRSDEDWSVYLKTAPRKLSRTQTYYLGAFSALLTLGADREMARTVVDKMIDISSFDFVITAMEFETDAKLKQDQSHKSIAPVPLSDQDMPS